MPYREESRGSCEGSRSVKAEARKKRAELKGQLKTGNGVCPTC